MSDDTTLKSRVWTKSHLRRQNIAHWLNVLLIVTLLVGMLPPVQPAMAAINQVEATGNKIQARHNIQTFPWYYPAFYVGLDDNDTVQNGTAQGRPFNLTVTNIDNLTSGNEANTTEFVGYVPGPNQGGWDLWSDQRCTEFDFGIILNLTAGATANVEALLSRVDVSSAGFADVKGKVLFYNTEHQYLGGWTWERNQDGQVRSANVNWTGLRFVRVCMNTGLSSDTPWTGYVDVKYIKVKPSSVKHIALPAAQSYAPNECPVCGSEERQNFVGGPINTQSGNYGYQVTDFNIATRGQPLRFERSYNSQTAAGNDEIYSRPLGYGWTHNYNISLSVSDNRAIFKAPHGSRMGFTQNGGAYEADPGVWAELVSNGGGYTLTAANQEQFLFNTQGKLTTHLDPHGNQTSLTYDTAGRLARVTSHIGVRYLDFGYDAQDRLTSVSNGLGWQVTYSYNANDDLVSVTDLRDKTWTYVYSGTTHLLHEVKDPTGVVLERTFYEDFGGGDIRATLQQNGASNTIAQIEYLPNGQRRITEGGQVTTETYNALNLLVSQEYAQVGCRRILWMTISTAPPAPTSVTIPPTPCATQMG